MSSNGFRPQHPLESDHVDQSKFGFPEAYFTLDGWLQDNYTEATISGPIENDFHRAIEVGSLDIQEPDYSRESETTEFKERYAFKTKSAVDVLDDGYKWRKYGKKMMKNSPNPRNYYRCLFEGCPVKKRVERDKEDPSYVITTYVGTHNHQSVS
ncbi:hypothetical protein HRI_002605000 [Hibiscus trionum]|uniref:WRKY domain-containing protein n=1 Tax=Hibiscus trionum TaxID=183268 RepID=A0A9W7M4D6_HIBTR|nr:hypothetical protein HRI_002605000 [Hibiscus trionum]